MFVQEMVRAVLKVLGQGGRWIQCDIKHPWKLDLREGSRYLLKAVIAPDTTVVADCVVFDKDHPQMEGDVEIGIVERGQFFGRGGYRCQTSGSDMRTRRILIRELRTRG